MNSPQLGAIRSTPRLVPNDSVAPGSVLAGRYAIESRIGEGGMGYVLRARHLELDTHVAIKVAHSELAKDPDVVGRLLEEARSMASIHSDYIVGVYDVGRLSDGTPYLVLEYVDGPDLDRVVAARGWLSSADAIAFALDVCAGLGVAHPRGVIHRDIKPENLLLATKSDGTFQIKISDFGIAKRPLIARARSFTLPSMALGSPSYMSPEQMRNVPEIDGRADIWSLGVVLYELCTGKLPFNGSTPVDVCTQVMTTRPLEPSLVRPGVVVGLDRVIGRCLQRDPADRYQSAADLAHDLALVEVPIGIESRRLVDPLLARENATLSLTDPQLTVVPARSVSTPPPSVTTKFAVARKATDARASRTSGALRLDLDANAAPAPTPARWPRIASYVALAAALAVLALAFAEHAAVSRLFASALGARPPIAIAASRPPLVAQPVIPSARPGAVVAAPLPSAAVAVVPTPLAPPVPVVRRRVDPFRASASTAEPVVWTLPASTASPSSETDPPPAAAMAPSPVEADQSAPTIAPIPPDRTP